MKKVVIIISLIILSIMLTGCSKEADFKLQITESSWSGWTEDYVPEEVTYKYDIVQGKEYSINSDRFVFEIIEVNSNNIVIKTKYPYSDNEVGVDLNSTKKEFTVYLDKELKLETPTMDAGEIYYLSLVK